MKNKSNNIAGTTTEQAINEVLKAENDSHQKISQCDAEAERILEQARQTARLVGERNNNRITLIHQRCSRTITDEITNMQRRSEQLKEDEQTDQFDINALTEVLERMALALTSAQHATTQKERE